MFCVYWTPDLSDEMFDCLLTAVATLQYVDRKASFLIVGGVNTHHGEWLGSSTINLHGRAALCFALSSGCEQIVAEPTHIEGRMFDLVLTDVPDVVGVRIGSLVVTSYFSAIFIDVVLEQLIPHVVFRQEVCLNNSVYWEVVRRDVKGLNWTGIIRFICLVSSVNEALLRIIKDRALKGTIAVRTGDKPWLITGVSWLTVRSREHIECVVAVGCNLTGRNIGWLIGVLS